MTDWQALERAYFMSSLYTKVRLPVTLVRGEGVRVWDDQGKSYLDFVAGWAVANLGHCPPVVIEAVSKQVATLIQVSNQFFTIPQVHLAMLLAQHSCADRAFFANSGAEANEGAIKLARRYGARKRDGAYEIITAFNSFHGRTLATTAATGQRHFQDPYEPLVPGFVHVPYNDIDAIKSATNEKTCAVLLEPLQGEGGVITPDSDYLSRVAEWCSEQNVLFMLDEIQTGMGRLGTLWGYQSFGAEPDVMTLAKGLASGVPIGALLAKEHAAVFAAGEHGTTFGGNPLACAAGLATLQYMVENDVPGNAARMGEYLRGRLRELKERHSDVSDVRGMGLLCALEFEREVAADAVRRCLAAGLLVNGVKPNTLRFMPPLVITEADVDEAIGILERVLIEMD